MQSSLVVHASSAPVLGDGVGFSIGTGSGVGASGSPGAMIGGGTGAGRVSVKRARAEPRPATSAIQPRSMPAAHRLKRALPPVAVTASVAPSRFQRARTTTFTVGRRSLARQASSDAARRWMWRASGPLLLVTARLDGGNRLPAIGAAGGCGCGCGCAAAGSATAARPRTRADRARRFMLG